MIPVKSIWNSYADIQNYPVLQENVSVDVAIIGGGITGITAAKLLAERGIHSIVLESHRVGMGTTSHSTGNLYSIIDTDLSSLKSKYDLDTVKEVTDARAEAVEQILQLVQKHEIDCDLKRVPMYLYSSDENNSEKIQKELEVGRKANLKMSEADPAEFVFPVTQALKISGQAQINPMRYVQGLAKSLNPELAQIYEQTHVSSVTEKNGEYLLKTSGGTVTAGKVIQATHTPKGIKLVHTLLGPYREYGIACGINDADYPEGIYWGYHGGGKKFSTRVYHRKGERFLIVVGEPHKVGHKKDNEECLSVLENFARQYFDIRDVNYKWGGQHYRPADLLPYIGPHQEESGEYIATGFSTDGLVYGTLSGMIISDQISGVQNRWSDLYSATRKQPGKSAMKFAKENVDVAKHLLKELVNFPGEELESLEKGKGRIMTHNGQKLAVSRNVNGEVEVVSAICTHMGCTVRWNNTEKSWDCPCHGSRFAPQGEVLEGPAFDALEKTGVKAS